MNDISAQVKTTMDNQMSDATDALQTMKTAAENGFAKASAGLEETQAQVKGQMEKALKKAEEVAAFGQGNMEAMMKSGQIWAAGFQDISKQFAAKAQSQMDHTMTTFKQMAGLRSLKDLMDVQSGFARAAVETAMAESGRLTDASLKLAEEALAPLTARVSLAVETFSKTA